MRLIGLTGGIATGKSTVAAMLAEHGVTIIDADQLARDVVQPGKPGYDAVVQRFGSEIVDPAGGIDRGRLGAVVFADAQARRELEGLLHPRIAELMQQRIAEAMQREATVAVLDIPLLFETSAEHTVEGVLLAYAPAAVQRERIMARDGLSAAEAQRRVDAQMPIDDKRARATWLIDNSASLAETRRQVDAWWRDEIER